MARLLVTGASGLLGLNLALEAMTAHTVIGADRRKLANTPFKLVNADLLDPGAVDFILDQAQPNWVVHCAALTGLEACEADPGLAHRLNADLPGELATACARRGIRLVHISTDAVFDGKRAGTYTEADAPSPIGVYSDTKLQSERAIAAANPDAIVARVNFYGWSLSGERSLAEWFFNNLSTGKRINGFTDVHFCPMLVNDLAYILLKMLEKGLRGLYHVVGAECMTKYEFGIAIARRFEFDETLITPLSVEESDLRARRAHNLRLSIHKLVTDLGSLVPTFSAGLERFYTQYQQGCPQKIRSYAQGSSRTGTLVNW